jgi:hypothetical protein
MKRRERRHSVQHDLRKLGHMAPIHNAVVYLALGRGLGPIRNLREKAAEYEGRVQKSG